MLKTPPVKSSIGEPVSATGLVSQGLEGNSTCKVWYSATVIHYTGNGLWTVGLVPVVRSKLTGAATRWEWIEDLTTEDVVGLLGRNTNHGIVRCTTEEVRQILRGCT